MRNVVGDAQLEYDVLARALDFANGPRVTRENAEPLYKRLKVLAPGATYAIEVRNGQLRAVAKTTDVPLRPLHAEQWRGKLMTLLDCYVTRESFEVRPAVERTPEGFRLNLPHLWTALTGCLVRAQFEGNRLRMASDFVFIPTLSELVAYAAALLSDEQRSWKEKLRRCEAPAKTKGICGRFFLIGGAHRPWKRCSDECDRRHETQRVAKWRRERALDNKGASE